MPETLALGPVRNTARVWVNGTLLTPAGGRGGRGRCAAPRRRLPAAGAPAGAASRQAARPGWCARCGRTAGCRRAGRRDGRRRAARGQRHGVRARGRCDATPIPSGDFHAGSNTITVQVTNQRAEGGFVGTNQDMYLMTGQTRTSLAGPWKYRVERSIEQRRALLEARRAGRARRLHGGRRPGRRGGGDAAHRGRGSGRGDSVERGAERNEVRDDRVDGPGRVRPSKSSTRIRIRRSTTSWSRRPDRCRRSARPPTRSRRRRMRRRWTTCPRSRRSSSRRRCWPAGQTTTFQFTAPAAPGDYPYICTYPNHWRIMNGVLHVVAPAGRGGGAGRGGAPAPATPAPGSGGGANRCHREASRRPPQRARR